METFYLLRSVGSREAPRQGKQFVLALLTDTYPRLME